CSSMPENQNPKMDDLLRRYARQRRAEAGASVQVDPATRQLLQAEVARNFEASSRPASSGLIGILTLWPRLLVGAASLAIVVLGVGLWLRHEDQRELAVDRAFETNFLFFAQSNPNGPNASSLPTEEPVPSRFQTSEKATSTDQGETPAETKAQTAAVAV